MTAKTVNGYRLGRLHRTYDPRVPQMSALLAGTTPKSPPPSCDWTNGMPKNLGNMLNNTLNICTCAAVYHAMQVWSFNTSKKMVTQPDTDVEELYIQACGYNPRVSSEGPDGNTQHVLTYWMNSGVPTGTNGQSRDHIAGFMEVDLRNLNDVKQTIVDCGVAYVGFNVPQFLIPPPPAVPPAVWDVRSTNAKIVGGHAVVLAGYDSNGARVISWGDYYTMTWKFLAVYVDEIYAIASKDWMSVKGTSPGGLSLAQLEEQMKALRGA
jgi:hypothetical protein